MKLSPARSSELMDELRLRTLFTEKALMRRYGVSRSTLTRMQAKALERPMTQNASDTVRIVISN